MATILSVDPFGADEAGKEKMIVRVVRSPYNIENQNRVYPFALSPEELGRWDDPQGVQTRGKKIRESLGCHPGVNTILSRLAETPIGEKRPLYIVLSESDAELISWETLYDNEAFMALDPRWPIGRIADPVTSSERAPATLQLPVKLMAIISAFGVVGQEREWQHLLEAVVHARATGLDVKLKLMVGSPHLRAAIDKRIAEGLPDVEVTHIEAVSTRVIHQIIQWQPHILHFFCHGRATSNEQSLELATGLAYENDDPLDGVVALTAAQIVAMSNRLTNPWLLTLNCCSSATATGSLHSFAHQSVSSGFPAAVAMAEAVDAKDAHEFTRVFYPAFLSALKIAVAALEHRPRVKFDWNDAMYDARTAICAMHEQGAPDSREWALPVIYLRGVDGFQFERPFNNYPEELVSEYKIKARTVADWLQASASSSTENQRLQVMSKVLAQVPQEFWPSVDGSLAS